MFIILGERSYQLELLSLGIFYLSSPLKLNGVDQIWQHESIYNPVLNQIGKDSHFISRRNKTSLSILKDWRDLMFLTLNRTMNSLRNMSYIGEHLIGTMRDIDGYKKHRLTFRVLLPRWIWSSDIWKSGGDLANKILFAIRKHFQGWDLLFIVLLLVMLSIKGCPRWEVLGKILRRSVLRYESFQPCMTARY